MDRDYIKYGNPSLMDRLEKRINELTQDIGILTANRKQAQGKVTKKRIKIEIRKNSVELGGFLYFRKYLFFLRNK